MVAIRVNILEGLVAVPDASVVGAEDKGGTTGVLPDDGVEQAVAPEAVVVAPEAVVLKEEDPGRATILAGVSEAIRPASPKRGCHPKPNVP